MIDHALEYARRGWAVLPLHTTDGPICSCPLGDQCPSPGKHPRIGGGVKSASSDADQVRRWWAQWPDAWIGVATGAPSGVWVLDIDSKAPDEESLDGWAALQFWQQQHGELDTLRSETGGGGLHLWFRMPDGRDVGNRQRLRVDGEESPRSGVDVRGTGGYVVAPPSGHKSGRSYAFEVTQREPCDAPAWLLELVAPQAVEHHFEAPSVALDAADRERRYAQRVLDGAVQAIMSATSGRHEVLNRKSYNVGGFAHLLGGVEACVAPLVQAFLVATGDPKREREGRRTALDALRAGAQRPKEVPNRDGYEELQRDPTWDEDPTLPEDDGDVPIDQTWWQDDQQTAPPRPAAPSDPMPDDDGPPMAHPVESRELPTIRTNMRQMRHVLDDAWSALRRMPAHRTVYQQDGRLVRVLQSEVGPRVEAVDGGALTQTLLTGARWVRLRKATAKDKVGAGQLFVETDADRLPGYLVPSMIGRPPMDLPVLERVARAPYVDGDGELVAGVGYHRETRTYLGPHPEVPDMPTEEAVVLLQQWLGDFPFARPHDYAHAIGFLLTPIVRHMIRGPVPVTVFEAPARGTGKTLLMKVLSRVAAGYPVSCAALAKNDEERRKSLVSHLATGAPVVLLDNVTGKVDDDTLAGILTAWPRYSDRRMGGQSLMWVPASSVWGMSGNNMVMSPDIARRAVVVRLDAGVERPEDRQGFRVRDLEQWTDDNAARLRGAALSLVRRWVDMGKPSNVPTLGSYEAWSRVVGGVVSEFFDGWLGGRAERLATADPEREEWRRLISIWSRRMSQALRASEVAEIAEEHELLLEVIGDGGKQSRARRMARALRNMRGVVLRVDGLDRQIRATTHKKANATTWRVDGGSVHTMKRQA